MDYEKAYKEALERAKSIHSFSSDLAEIKRMEQLFPELAETEEKRIRQNCIHFLELQKSHHAATFEIEECIDWLEKQGNNTYSWKPSDKQLEAFEHFVRSIGESGYASLYDNNTKLLYSLLFDLKKLADT